MTSAKNGKQNGDTRTRKPEPGYLNLSIDYRNFGIQCNTHVVTNTDNTYMDNNAEIAPEIIPQIIITQTYNRVYVDII